jgi:hypothetical protein
VRGCIQKTVHGTPVGVYGVWEVAFVDVELVAIVVSSR